MGLLDIFNKNDQPVEPVHDPADDYDKTPSQHITIDVSEEYITINGNKFMFPVEMEKLFELFGEAQKHTFGKVNIEFLSQEDNDMINDAVSEQRANFAWNDLGLYAFTNEKKRRKPFGRRLKRRRCTFVQQTV